MKKFISLAFVLAMFIACDEDPVLDTPEIVDIREVHLLGAVNKEVNSEVMWSYTADAITTSHFALDTVLVDYSYGMTLEITTDIRSEIDMSMSGRRIYRERSGIKPTYMYEENVRPDDIDCKIDDRGLRHYTVHFGDPERLLFFANDVEYSAPNIGYDIPGNGRAHSVSTKESHKSDTWYFSFYDKAGDIDYAFDVRQTFSKWVVGYDAQHYTQITTYYTYINANFRNQ